jgi:phage portal protein BeeE
MKRRSFKPQQQISATKPSLLQPTEKQRSDVFEVANFATQIYPEDLIQERTDYELRYAFEKYVPFFDCYGDFNQTLINALMQSPTYGSIFEQKVEMVLGADPILLNGNSSIFQKKTKPQVLSDIEILAIEPLLLNLNNDNENLIDIEKVAVANYFAFGNAYVQVTRIKTQGKYKYRVVNLENKNVLLHKDNGKNGFISCVGISDNFSDKSTLPIEIPLFPIFGKTNIKGVEATIFHIKKNSPGFKRYGLPEIAKSLFWTSIEYNIPKTNDAELRNGFRASGIIQMFGQYTEKQAKAMTKSIVDKFTSPKNEGKLFVQIARDEKSKANIIPLNNRYEGNYLELSQMAVDKIVGAMSWSKSLAGYETSGKLGTNEQIKIEYDICTARTIIPTQQLFCNKFLNPIIKLITERDDVIFQHAQLTPISFFGKFELKDVLTKNEMREEMGYAPDETNVMQNNT